MELYLIEILHQTTTLHVLLQHPRSLYLIEILHQTTTRVAFLVVQALLYLIEILHQTTTIHVVLRRISPLYLIEILHQTTTLQFCYIDTWRCILSKFYIKPQPILCISFSNSVVSYRNSTSNHNTKNANSYGYRVVSYRNSTSNHNKVPIAWSVLKLYLIEILHQTTTFHGYKAKPHLLYLIEILHQTTTLILAKKIYDMLYLIEILHQTTTSGLILIDKVLLTGCLPL